MFKCAMDLEAHKHYYALATGNTPREHVVDLVQAGLAELHPGVVDVPTGMEDFAGRMPAARIVRVTDSEVVTSIEGHLSACWVE